MTTNRRFLLIALPLTIASSLALGQTGSAQPAATPVPPAQQPAATTLPSNAPPAAPSRLSTPNPPQNSAPPLPTVGTNPTANQGVRDPNAPGTAAPTTTVNPGGTVSVQSPTALPQTPTGTPTPNVTTPTPPLPGSAINGAPTPLSRSASLSALDRNRDGYISADEFAANSQASSVVADCDTDRDGKIASYEYSACVDKIPQR